MFCWDIPETMAIDILNSSKTGHIVKAFVAFGGNELGTHLGPDFATLVGKTSWAIDFGLTMRVCHSLPWPDFYQSHSDG